LPEETSAHAATVRDALSRNVVVDVLSRVGYMFSRFFVPPFILARISLEAYGLWSTSFILVSYIGVSTLGISNVYIKYVAQHSARREYQQANALLSTGVFLTLPICFLLFAALWLAWPFLATLLHIPSHLMGDAHEVILSVVATFLASICLSVFHDVLVGVQRTALVQYIWTACYIVETALIFLLVGMGRGVRGLAEATSPALRWKSCCRCRRPFVSFPGCESHGGGSHAKPSIHFSFLEGWFKSRACLPFFWTPWSAR